MIRKFTLDIKFLKTCHTFYVIFNSSQTICACRKLQEAFCICVISDDSQTSKIIVPSLAEFCICVISDDSQTSNFIMYVIQNFVFCSITQILVSENFPLSWHSHIVLWLREYQTPSKTCHIFSYNLRC